MTTSVRYKVVKVAPGNVEEDMWPGVRFLYKERAEFHAKRSADADPNDYGDFLYRVVKVTITEEVLAEWPGGHD